MSSIRVDCVNRHPRNNLSFILKFYPNKF